MTLTRSRTFVFNVRTCVRERKKREERKKRRKKKEDERKRKKEKGKCIWKYDGSNGILEKSGGNKCREFSWLIGEIV